MIKNSFFTIALFMVVQVHVLNIKNIKIVSASETPALSMDNADINMNGVTETEVQNTEIFMVYDQKESEEVAVGENVVPASYLRIFGMTGDGEIVWEKCTDSYILSAKDYDMLQGIGLYGDIYYYLENHMLFALDKNNAEVLWSYSDFDMIADFDFGDHNILFLCAYEEPDFLALDEAGKEIVRIEQLDKEYRWPCEIQYQGKQAAISYRIYPEDENGVYIISLDDYSFHRMQEWERDPFADFIGHRRYEAVVEGVPDGYAEADVDQDYENKKELIVRTVDEGDEPSQTKYYLWFQDEGICGGSYISDPTGKAEEVALYLADSYQNLVLYVRTKAEEYYFYYGFVFREAVLDFCLYKTEDEENGTAIWYDTDGTFTNAQMLMSFKNKGDLAETILANSIWGNYLDKLELITFEELI